MKHMTIGILSFCGRNALLKSSAGKRAMDDEGDAVQVCRENRLGRSTATQEGHGALEAGPQKPPKYRKALTMTA